MAKSLHERRKITFAELGALYGVLGMIKDKLLVHTQDTVPSGNEHGFNMRVQCRTNMYCGSVGCIGGTMALVMGMTPDAALCYVGIGGYIGTASPSLEPLFYPPGDGEEWDKIGLPESAKAIRNFLDTGKPQWKKVLSRKRHV